MRYQKFPSPLWATIAAYPVAAICAGADGKPPAPARPSPLPVGFLPCARSTLGGPPFATAPHAAATPLASEGRKSGAARSLRVARSFVQVPWPAPVPATPARPSPPPLATVPRPPRGAGLPPPTPAQPPAYAVADAAQSASPCTATATRHPPPPTLANVGQRPLASWVPPLSHHPPRKPRRRLAAVFLLRCQSSEFL